MKEESLLKEGNDWFEANLGYKLKYPLSREEVKIACVAAYIAGSADTMEHFKMELKNENAIREV